MDHRSVVHQVTLYRGWQRHPRQARLPVKRVGSTALATALEIVTLPENALVPPGAHITTQEDADALELIGGAEEEFKEAVFGNNGGYSRVVGDVTIGPNSETSDRVSVRADESTRPSLGPRPTSRRGSPPTQETSIEVGDDLTAGGDAVLHGLLVIDIGLTVGYDSVVFRFIVEHGATVGDDVIIQGPAWRKAKSCLSKSQPGPSSPTAPSSPMRRAFKRC